MKAYNRISTKKEASNSNLETIKTAESETEMFSRNNLEDARFESYLSGYCLDEERTYDEYDEEVYYNDNIRCFDCDEVVEEDFPVIESEVETMTEITLAENYFVTMWYEGRL